MRCWKKRSQLKDFHVALGSFEIGNRTPPAMRFPGSPGSSGAVGRNRIKKFGLSASNEHFFCADVPKKVVPQHINVFSIGNPFRNLLKTLCLGVGPLFWARPRRKNVRLKRSDRIF